MPNSYDNFLGVYFYRDTVGDPLKDTSGPSLNIVMKLMAIISLVFADFFVAIYNGHGVFKAAQ
jgi:hypothetical protein